MNILALQERAMVIRKLYEEYEKGQYGRSWTDEEIALGLVGDVGDLMKLVQAKNNVRLIEDVDSKIAHELSDCLWSIMVLANKYGINIEMAFLQTMNELEAKLSKKD